MNFIGSAAIEAQPHFIVLLVDFIVHAGGRVGKFTWNGVSLTGTACMRHGCLLITFIDSRMALRACVVTGYFLVRCRWCARRCGNIRLRECRQGVKINRKKNGISKQTPSQGAFVDRLCEFAAAVIHEKSFTPS